MAGIKVSLVELTKHLVCVYFKMQPIIPLAMICKRMGESSLICNVTNDQLDMQFYMHGAIFKGVL